MTRVATEACSRSAAEWMRDRFGNPTRKYRPPPGKGLKRKLLRGTPKSVASRYYQLLTGLFVCYLLFKYPATWSRSPVPLPRKPGQRRAFLSYTHFLALDQKENGHSGAAPISFSPNLPRKRATQGKQK